MWCKGKFVLAFDERDAQDFQRSVWWFTKFTESGRWVLCKTTI